MDPWQSQNINNQYLEAISTLKPTESLIIDLYSAAKKPTAKNNMQNNTQINQQQSSQHIPIYLPSQVRTLIKIHSHQNLQKSTSINKFQNLQQNLGYQEQRVQKNSSKKRGFKIKKQSEQQQQYFGNVEKQIKTGENQNEIKFKINLGASGLETGQHILQSVNQLQQDRDNNFQDQTLNLDTSHQIIPQIRVQNSEKKLVGAYQLYNKRLSVKNESRFNNNKLHNQNHHYLSHMNTQLQNAKIKVNQNSVQNIPRSQSNTNLATPLQQSQSQIHIQKLTQEKELRELSMHRHKEMDIQEKKTRDLLRKITTNQIQKNFYVKQQQGSQDLELINIRRNAKDELRDDPREGIGEFESDVQYINTSIAERQIQNQIHTTNLKFQSNQIEAQQIESPTIFHSSSDNQSIYKNDGEKGNFKIRLNVQDRQQIPGFQQYLSSRSHISQNQFLPNVSNQQKSRNQAYFNQSKTNKVMSAGSQYQTMQNSNSSPKMSKTIASLDDKDELKMRMKLRGKLHEIANKKVTPFFPSDQQHLSHNQQVENSQNQIDTNIDSNKQQVRVYDKTGKKYFDQLQDKFEKQMELRSQKYFKNIIKEKIAEQYNETPASLVALQHNRKYILEQLLNKKALFQNQQQSQKNLSKITSSQNLGNISSLKSLQKTASKQNLNTSNLSISPSKSNIQLPALSSRQNQNSAQRSRFLQELRQLSIGKFKEVFMQHEDQERKLQEVKKYTSRSQYENAANYYRFLPPERQKKIEKQLNRVIDEKQRQVEMEKYLEYYVREGDVNDNDMDGNDTGEDGIDIDAFDDNYDNHDQFMMIQDKQ
eukprot:403374766